MNSRAALASLLLVLPAVAQKAAAVGEKVPDFSFPAFLNGDGRQSLKDFFGSPIMIDYWGTHCGPCIGFAVPTAIKHDHELSSRGLVTVLMERQGADTATLTAFMQQRFPDNDAFVCVSGSVPTPEFQGLPHTAVIGVDGTLLFDGSPSDGMKPIEEAIEAELTKVKKGWGDTAETRKVRAALYGKGDLAGAAAMVAALPEGEERTMLQSEVENRYALAKKAVPTLQEQGRFLAAQTAAKSLLKAVGQKAEWVAEVTPLVAEFDKDTAKAELAAEKKLEKIDRALRDKKEDGAVKALQALAKSAGSGKVGERVGSILKALETKLAE